MNEEQVLKDMIDYCNRRIEEVKLPNSYYEKIKRNLQVELEKHKTKDKI